MGDTSKKKSLSQILGPGTNPGKKASFPKASFPRIGPTGADRAKAAFDQHLKTVKSAQETFQGMKKRNRGY